MNPYPLKLSAHVRTYYFGERLIPDRLGKVDVPEGRVAETWEISDYRDTSGIVRNGEFAGSSLHDLVEQLRSVAVLLKPFLPQTAETIYRSFNFAQPWEEVRHEDVWVHPTQTEDVRLVAPLEGGGVKPLFPRIREKKE